jgi:hypothetical protein
MLLFNREIQTSGDFEKLMPIIQESISIANGVGVPLNAWAGSNGCVPGTLVFGAVYESLAARAAATAKLQSTKSWWEMGRKFNEFVVSAQPDNIYNFVRGGSTGAEIPNGTVVQQNYFQIAQGGDFLAALKWMNELVDLGKNITGVDSNIVHTLFGTLGAIGYFAGYANAAQIDEVRAKIAANTEWFPKFLEGGKFAMAGTVVQRHIIKIA